MDFYCTYNINYFIIILWKLIMPTYRFKNNDTGEEFEQFMSISAREKYLLEFSNITTMPVTMNIVHERGTNLPIDDGFREVLSKIKQTYTINNIKSY